MLQCVWCIYKKYWIDRNPGPIKKEAHLEAIGTLGLWIALKRPICEMIPLKYINKCGWYTHLEMQKLHKAGVFFLNLKMEYIICFVHSK